MGASVTSLQRGRSRRTAAGGRSTSTIGDRVALPGSPAAIRALASHGGPATRSALVDALQRLSGNAAATALVGRAIPVVQRWAVGLAPGTTDCARIVNYMNAHSPYRATSGWARTRVTFTWSGDPVFSGSGASTTVSVANPSVTVSKAVDMPQWSPTDPGISAAWSAMTSDLRAHEARHEAIGDQWRATLESRLAALSAPVTNRAAWRRAVQAEFNAWVRDHQADQNAIDPYTAVLDCSGAESESESASAESTPLGEATVGAAD